MLQLSAQSQRIRWGAFSLALARTWNVTGVLPKRLICLLALRSDTLPPNSLYSWSTESYKLRVTRCKFTSDQITRHFITSIYYYAPCYLSNCRIWWHISGAASRYLIYRSPRNLHSIGNQFSEAVYTTLHITVSSATLMQINVIGCIWAFSVEDLLTVVVPWGLKIGDRSLSCAKQPACGEWLVVFLLRSQSNCHGISLLRDC